MNKIRKDNNEEDFGQWLYELRIKQGLTIEQLTEKINMINVSKINIRKWERDLEFPEIDVIYKLSEIYMISAAEIIDKKQKTLQTGVEGIHKYIIRWLSFMMGLSIYGTIIFCRVILTIILICATIWFYNVCMN